MSRRAVAISTTVVVAAFAVAAVLIPGPRRVEVTYADGACAVDLDPATIYSNRLVNVFRPKRVKWEVDPGLGFEWTFRHKGVGADLLGSSEIPAGNRSTRSGRSTTSGSWEYDILVDDQLCLDPLVIINR